MRSILLASLVAVAGTLSLARADEPAKKAKAMKAELVDINTASADQLKALPGITDEVVAKIVAGRPYKGKDALLKQKMVTKDEYAKLRPLIIAKQAKAAKATPPADGPKPVPPAAAPSPSPAPPAQKTAAPPAGTK